MTKFQKYKNVISRFISSEKGQRFFNFAYSIGAAVVIWGALFKILHLPGGNALLSLGMGTEVLMFLLTAFDRPPKEYDWEKVYPQLNVDDEDEEGGAAAHVQAPVQGIPASAIPAGAIPSGVPVSAPAGAVPDLAQCSREYLETLSSLTADLKELQTTTAALNEVSTVLLNSYKAISGNSEAITRSSEGYVEQMTALHRNIQGLNTIYEVQLHSVSGQIESIDRVNRGIKDIRDMYEKSAAQSARYAEETERMARYMQQINSVYEKMITAMTVNMYRPAGVTPPDIDGVPLNKEATHAHAENVQ